MDFSQRLQTGSHRFAQIFLLIGIIFVVNVLSLNHFARLDFSENNQFSISPASKDMLANLNDLVTIKAYISQDLPPHFLPLSRSIQDFLEEYKAYGGLNLRTVVTDPASDSQALQEVQNLQIPQIQVNVIERDASQSRQAYIGLAMFYADKTATIPVIDSTGTLEYQLTSAIKKLTATEVKKVGFLTGHDEHMIMENQYDPSKAGDYTIIRQQLEENYEVTPVSIVNGQLQPQVSTLIIPGPKQALKDYEVLAIDQFLMNGGNLIALIDRINLTGPSLEAVTIDSGLEDFLKNLGVVVEKNAVADISNGVAQFVVNNARWAVNYQWWPKFTAASFNLENPIVSHLEYLLLPWSSSLTVTETDQTKILVQSNKSSWMQTDQFNFQPSLGFGQIAPPEDQLTSATMAALVSGNFTSYFKDKPVPVAPAAEGANTTPTQAPQILTTNQKAANVLVIGDSDFLANNFIQDYPSNLKFFLNAVDFLTLDPSLINIRSKQVSERPIGEISEAKKVIYRMLAVWSGPILVIIFGIARTYHRRRAKKLST